MDHGTARVGQSSATHTRLGSADGQLRVLSEDDCRDIGTRLTRMSTGGGETFATIFSTWRGNVRWARNQISMVGEDRQDHVVVCRTFGKENRTDVTATETTDDVLHAAVRRVEQLVQLRHLPSANRNQISTYVPEPLRTPALFSDATSQMDIAQAAAAADQLTQTAAAAGVLSAGYMEVTVHSLARVTSWGFTRYFPYTWAQCSLTVRDVRGRGSGWAGVDWPDWQRIDTSALNTRAIDKCLTSRTPVAIEPGRYTTIFEPQAVGDFVGELVYGRWTPLSEYQILDLKWSTESSEAPFNQHPEASRVGERVVDERITISADPMDPDLGFPPINLRRNGIIDTAYSPVTWIDHGVLTNLSYNRWYGQRRFGPFAGLPLEGAFRMSGGETSVAEMIETTPRGILVTRFDSIRNVDIKSLLLRGYTRDGLWLIEHGKISKPVQNMVFTESILAALNNVEQLGLPQRVFHPNKVFSEYRDLPQPVVVPPLKIRDFAFTALTAAV